MASLVSDIPLKFMDPQAKFALINWLVEQGFPARVSRRILQEWGEALHVTLNSTDYDLLNNHFKLVKG